MKRIVPLITLLIALVVLLCACSKEINVTVFDAGETQTIQANTGDTVEQTLAEAGITIATRDEVSPSLETVISEDTTEIEIKRYAKVTVSKGSDSQEIELVGGTVQQAVEQSGFTVDEDEELDQDANAYLTDGMVIKILHEVSVTLKADGETKEVKTKAVTVEELLAEQNITLGADDEISEKRDSLLEDGMKITVKRVQYKEETRTESIDYKTEERPDDSMYKGETRTAQEGVKGEKVVTYKVKYVDGEEDSKEQLSEEITREPTTKIVAVGSKARMLTEEEARAIVIDFWNLPADYDRGTLLYNGLKSSGGIDYYAYILRWRVDDGDGTYHYSAIDYQRVNAYTGEVTEGM